VSQGSLFTEPTAEEEKAAAFARMVEGETAAAFVRRCRHALLSLVQRQETATIEDVRAVVPIPEGMNPKLYGTVPGGLASAGAIRQAGYVKGVRRESHARPIAAWKAGNLESLYLWIAANPLPKHDS
jgi:hypothetical protein